MLSKKKSQSILYVESDMHNQKKIKAILEKSDYQVEISGGGKKALKMLQKNFSAVILNTSLIDMSGWELCQKIRNEGYGKCLPIIALIEHNRTLNEQDPSEFIDEYVKTPVDADLLIQAIQKILGEKSNSKWGSQRFYLGDKYPGVYLTSRELQCMKFLIQGYSYSEVGGALSISARTVESYSKNMMDKLVCSTKQELIKKIYKSDFLQKISSL